MENIKYLGIDWGEKRIGLSLGDSETKIATPFKVVKNIDEVIEIINEEDVDEIIIGEPKKMAGSDIKMSDLFLKFSNKLENSINIPLHKIDERLSSKAADSLVGSKATKAPRDAIAAMLILQTYLDQLK